MSKPGAGVVPMAPGKRSLMEAAVRLAARQGNAHTLVLREVAREAGLNHNTFYRHFESLEAMMHEIVREFGQALRQGLKTARSSVPAGQPLSQHVVAWLFDFARDHPDVFTVAIRERYGPPGPVRDAVRGMLEQLRRDMLHELSVLARMPKLQRARLLRLLRVLVDQTFQACLEYLESPRRRKALLAAAQELFETVMLGAVALSARTKTPG